MVIKVKYKTSTSSFLVAVAKDEIFVERISKVYPNEIEKLNQDELQIFLESGYVWIATQTIIIDTEKMLQMGNFMKMSGAWPEVVLPSFLQKRCPKFFRKGKLEKL